MSSILIISPQDYTRQPRVLRTIEALNEHDLTIAGYSNSIDHGLSFVSLNDPQKNNTLWYFGLPTIIRWPFSLINRIQRHFDGIIFENLVNCSNEAFKQLKSKKFDLIICHGYESLPLAHALSKSRIKVVFNAHEYYPLEFENDITWMQSTKPLIDKILSKYLPKCDLMFCVSDAIADEYKKNYSIKSITITNAPKEVDVIPTETHSPIRVIHHGAAIEMRELERMAETIILLGPDYELTFMLFGGSESYLNDLKSKYSNVKNIKFMNPVPVNQISVALNSYDIGLFILPPVNFNWKNALPNKLFEFIQGRLCIAVSPNPDMAKLVINYDLGVVAKDYTAIAMADAIRGIGRNGIQKYKINSSSAALVLNATNNKRLISSSINTLLN